LENPIEKEFGDMSSELIGTRRVEKRESSIDDPFVTNQR
jgi:hypothetical protein